MFIWSLPAVSSARRMLRFSSAAPDVSFRILFSIALEKTHTITLGTTPEQHGDAVKPVSQHMCRLPFLAASHTTSPEYSTPAVCSLVAPFAPVCSRSAPAIQDFSSLGVAVYGSMYHDRHFCRFRRNFQRLVRWFKTLLCRCATNPQLGYRVQRLLNHIRIC